MSLFKTRDWWSAAPTQEESYSSGALCILSIGASDKIVVGSLQGLLKIYDPSPSSQDYDPGVAINQDSKPEHLTVEKQMPGGPILQLVVGQFISASDGVQVAVLHCRCVAVVTVASQEGNVEHGNQHDISIIYQHKLERSAFNFIAGPFGGVIGRDFICVQSLDCTLTFYEQENFAFSRFLPSSLLPGPLAYASKSDCFITVSTSQFLESYKYQVLAVASESSTKEEAETRSTGKRVSTDWKLNIGECALQISIIESDATTASIIVLGERSLFCVSQSGQIRFMKKYDFEPACMLCYNVTSEGWIQYAIASYSNLLFVYCDTTLKWAAQLPHVPVSIKLVKFGYTSGLLACLDEEGHLRCCYLGTDPALIGAGAMQRRTIDFEAKQNEYVELMSLIKDSSSEGGSLNTAITGSTPELTIVCNVPSKFDDNSVGNSHVMADDAPVPSLTISVILSAAIPLSQVQLNIHAPVPLEAYPKQFSFPSFTSSEKLSFSVYLKYPFVPSSLQVTVQAAYSTDDSVSGYSQSQFKIPFKLIARSIPVSKQATHKITIETNKAGVDLNEIYSEFYADSSSSSVQAMGFQLFGQGAPSVFVLVSKNARKYRVQSDNFEMIWVLLKDLVERLEQRYGRDELNVDFNGNLPLPEYFNLIDHHFDLTKRLDQLEKVLEEKCSQLRAIERRLISKFKDTTPAPLTHMDTLLEITYRQILNVSGGVHDLMDSINGITNAVCAASELLSFLLYCQSGTLVDDQTYLDNILWTKCNTDFNMSWESRVSSALNHVMHILNKSQSAAPVRDDGSQMMNDTNKLKKQLTFVFDKMSKGHSIADASSLDASNSAALAAQKNKKSASKLETIMEDSTYFSEDIIEEAVDEFLETTAGTATLKLEAKSEPVGSRTNFVNTTDDFEFEKTNSINDSDMPTEFTATNDQYLFDENDNNDTGQRSFPVDHNSIEREDSNMSSTDYSEKLVKTNGNELEIQDNALSSENINESKSNELNTNQLTDPIDKLMGRVKSLKSTGNDDLETETVFEDKENNIFDDDDTYDF